VRNERELMLSGEKRDVNSLSSELTLCTLKQCFVIPTGASALPFRRCFCGGRTGVPGKRRCCACGVVDAQWRDPLLALGMRRLPYWAVTVTVTLAVPW
jgi:hypothetical protein